ncbi:hypothetical protein, partial [Bacillus pumilus]|uniref:hypothetical protein n=1 Tax=Bacillus pumilus TaxID=1408 RepID=UPI001C98C4EE
MSRGLGDVYKRQELIAGDLAVSVLSSVSVLFTLSIIFFVLNYICQIICRNKYQTCLLYTSPSPRDIRYNLG